jgi:uncharacterized protein (TIGR02453 family)
MKNKPRNYKFTGFSQETLDFLQWAGVSNKAWYDAHREEFKNKVLLPFQQLVEDLGPGMLKLDSRFEITPKVDKTISRVYRDTRFSKNKSPYRSNMWLTFKVPVVDWKISPAFYFEIYPEYYRYGMGYYEATKECMDLFRARLASRPSEFQKAISFFTPASRYSLEGEDYKRLEIPDIPKVLIPWYQKKSFYLMKIHKIDEVLFSSQLVDLLESEFKKLSPLYHYLQELVR